MKHLLILLVITVATITVSQAQTSTKKVDNKYKLENGNVIVPVVASKASNHDSTTTYHYADHGNLLPVYISAKGSYYVWLTSKKGNRYKKYLKFDK